MIRTILLGVFISLLLMTESLQARRKYMRQDTTDIEVSDANDPSSKDGASEDKKTTTDVQLPPSKKGIGIPGSSHQGEVLKKDPINNNKGEESSSSHGHLITIPRPAPL